MNEMALPSRHRIRNLSSGGLRPSAPPLGHEDSLQFRIFTGSGEEIFVCLKLECQSGTRARDLRLSMQAALTTAPGPPPKHVIIIIVLFKIL